MGGLTPQKKKLSSSKVSQKALKCTVQMKIQAITCPGVVLPNQEDLYLSVCVMGQFKKTLCLPPVFPLLFHENIVFVKTFTGAADPGHIVDLLEADTTSFELIQLVPPEGDILATIEENTREFLYPGPKLSPRAGGPDREMLMRRSICFPGISPKVEFTTMSVIEECDGKDSQPQPASPPCCNPSPARRRPVRGAVGSPRQTLKVKDLSLTGPSSGYEQPTVASQARALSPYTHRRMCQLSEEARQRLSYLQLGPYMFKKETEPQIPFVVGTGCLKTQKSPGKSSRQDCSRTTVRMARSALAAQSSTPVCGPRSPLLSPLLSRSSLRERLCRSPMKRSEAVSLGSIVVCPVRLRRSTVESRRFSTPMLLTGNYTLRMGVCLSGSLCSPVKTLYVTSRTGTLLERHLSTWTMGHSGAARLPATQENPTGLCLRIVWDSSTRTCTGEPPAPPETYINHCFRHLSGLQL